MLKKISDILRTFEEERKKITSIKEASALRLKYVGRQNGQLNQILRKIKFLPVSERKEVGKLANAAARQILKSINATENNLKDLDSHKSLTDLTEPGIKPRRGHLHPLTLMQMELIDIFRSMGFSVLEGPELEHDFYNFTALNFKPEHPARDIQDTFFIKSKITNHDKRALPAEGPWVLRTHTSNMQMRVMQENQPPLRYIIPGRTFRNEATDARHEHTFYQLEGFVVDEKITIGHLEWTLHELFRQLYGPKVKIRLRPGFFPFTEPSYEPEMSCVFCDKSDMDCKICKGTGWVEMAGAGMIHPNVFKFSGYPHHKFTGFAFGFGLNRLAMLKYGISDIRLFMENDLRFLQQF